MNEQESLTRPPRETQPAGSARKSRWRKWLRRLFWSVICLISLFVVLAASYVIITNYRGEVAKEEILKEIKERGLETDHTYLEENETDSPSEDSESPHQTKKREKVENNRKDGTHLYLAAFELGRRDSKELPDDIPHLGTLDTPELAKPVEEGLEQRLREYTKQHKEYYSFLQDARACNHFSFNLDYLNNPYANGPSAIHILAAYRKAARRLNVLSLHEQASGNPDKALQACGAILDTNNSLNREPPIIVSLVRIATASIATNSAEGTLSRTFPTKNALEEFRESLLKELQSVNLKECFKWEIATLAIYARNPSIPFYKGILGIAYASRHHWGADLIPIESNWGDVELAQPASKVKIQLLLSLTNLWHIFCPGEWKLGFARLIEEQLKWHDKCDLPSEKLIGKIKKELNRKQDLPEETSGYLRWMIKMFEHKSRMKVSATALSVERYRLEHGNWPDNLNQIQTESQILKDPFTGDLLKYKHTGTGCIVYSVGKNQKDDGGKRARTADGKDDIAFRLFDPGKRARE